MHKPCNHCPFRSDRPFRGLTRDRALQIHQALHADGGFPCHGTVEYSDEGEPKMTKDSMPCIGAAAYLNHTCTGGARANVWFRLYQAFGSYDWDSVDGSHVCKSLEQFIENSVG